MDEHSLCEQRLCYRHKREKAECKDDPTGILANAEDIIERQIAYWRTYSSRRQFALTTRELFPTPFVSCSGILQNGWQCSDEVNIFGPIAPDGTLISQICPVSCDTCNSETAAEDLDRRIAEREDQLVDVGIDAVTAFEKSMNRTCTEPL